MPVRLVHSAKLAEACSPFAKVLARCRMALADWAEDTRCAFFHRVQRCILRRRVKACMLGNGKRVSDDAGPYAICASMLRCAGENHISIAPDRFLHLHGQAQIHMYICYMWMQLEEIFLLCFKYLGILRTEIPSSNCCEGGRWAVVSYYSQGRASV